MVNADKSQCVASVRVRWTVCGGEEKEHGTRCVRCNSGGVSSGDAASLAVVCACVEVFSGFVAHCGVGYAPAVWSLVLTSSGTRSRLVQEAHLLTLVQSRVHEECRGLH